MILTILSEIYHADRCDDEIRLSNSIAKILLAKSPLHAFLAHPRLNPDFEPMEDKKFDVGTAWHSLLFEGKDIVTVCDFKDWRTNAAKEVRDEAYLAGRCPLLPEQAEAVREMAGIANEAILRVLGINLKKDGKSEQTILWKDGETNCKLRADWVSNDLALVLDGKTTDLSSPNAFLRAIPANGYDIQSAFYKRGVAAENGGKQPQFVFVVQEAIKPYPVYFVTLSQAYEATATVKIEKALKIWQACLDGDVWPAYSQEVMIAEPPSWTMAEAEETAIEMEGWSVEDFLAGRIDGGKCRV
jgi:hypothetical protein